MSPTPIHQIRQSIEASAIKVVSVDVFDTLLLRDTTPEPARFKCISSLQAEALKRVAKLPLNVADFYLLRRDAARSVYSTKTRRNGGREASWQEIFELIFSTLEIPHDKTLFKLCLEIELEYERTKLSLNKQLAQFLEMASEKGKVVVCLSDMYLSSEQIGKLIDAVAGREMGLVVYSSADYGFGKGCGALFSRLAEDYAVGFSEIFHCGDNWYADYRVPTSLGIRANYLPRSTGWRIARKLRSYWFERSTPAL